MAETFRQAVVKSVTLSCLLTIDFVPGAKRPPVEEMVARELPKVLRVAREHLGPLALDIQAHIATDPADLLARATEAIIDHKAASNLIIEHGHEDFVFSALQYARKPPTATSRRIQRLTHEVAAALGVSVPKDFDDLVGDMYDLAHGMIIKV